MKHVPPKDPTVTAFSNMRHHALLLPFTCSHAPTTLSCAYTRHRSTRPPALWCHGWRHHPLRSDLLFRPTRFDPFILTWIRTACKKNKNKRKGALTKLDLWLWPKSQNFQNRLVPLSFSSTFRFWDPFLHSKLGNCANVQFPESWLFHKSWPKVKIFKPDLSCPIFHVDSNFEVYFFIWESKIAQIVWFYSCWLWCELWPRIKMSEQSLSYSNFCKDSDFEICLFILDLETTNLTHFSEVLAVSKT